MIAGALGYSAHQLTYLISTDIFMCGVATFLQLQLNKHFGIGLPVMLGVAFQSVAPLIMIGKSHGSGAMFGALIISGIYVIFVSGVFSKFANLFPSIVTGSVITTIGLTLILSLSEIWGTTLTNQLVKASSLQLSRFLSSFWLIFLPKDLSNQSQS